MQLPLCYNPNITKWPNIGTVFLSYCRSLNCYQVVGNCGQQQMVTYLVNTGHCRWLRHAHKAMTTDCHNAHITYMILYITFYVTTIMNIFGHKVWLDIMMQEYEIQMQSQNNGDGTGISPIPMENSNICLSLHMEIHDNHIIIQITGFMTSHLVQDILNSVHDNEMSTTIVQLCTQR